MILIGDSPGATTIGAATTARATTGATTAATTATTPTAATTANAYTTPHVTTHIRDQHPYLHVSFRPLEQQVTHTKRETRPSV